MLVGLYEEPERPANAVDYIKKYMGAPTGVDVEALRAENERFKVENESLTKALHELNAKVRACARAYASEVGVGFVCLRACACV